MLSKKKKIKDLHEYRRLRKQSVVKSALLDDWVKGYRSFYCPECAKRLLKEAENE